jgi:hypothetical protein
MSTTVVDLPQRSHDGRRTTVSSTIKLAGKEYQIWYAFSEPLNVQTGETFFAASLLPAMKVGQPLEIKAPVSAKLLTNAQRIQEIFHGWFPELKIIPIQAQHCTLSAAGSPEVGAFFSGGVDSFYTLLKHQREITRIIYVHGLDIWLKDEEFRQKVVNELRVIGDALGKPLLEVETNLRDYSDLYVDWGFHANGAALASVAQLLAPQFHKVYIPSSHKYKDMFPWGSHPIVDPLWSTEQLDLVHDGCEASRVQKVASIAQSPVALSKLRVCYENLHSANEGNPDFYNCGSCEKCLRTMVNLHLVGGLNRCATFPHDLDFQALSRIVIADENTFSFVNENLEAATSAGNQGPLVEALETCIQRYRRRLLEKELEHLRSSTWWDDWLADKKNSIIKALWDRHRRWVNKTVLIENVKFLDRLCLRGMGSRAYKKLSYRG